MNLHWFHVEIHGAPMSCPGLIGQLQPSTAHFSETKAAGRGPHFVHKDVLYKASLGEQLGLIMTITNPLNFNGMGWAQDIQA
jgi:hypothetical protein